MIKEQHLERPVERSSRSKNLTNHVISERMCLGKDHVIRSFYGCDWGSQPGSVPSITLQIKFAIEPLDRGSVVLELQKRQPCGERLRSEPKLFTGQRAGGSFNKDCIRSQTREVLGFEKLSDNSFSFPSHPLHNNSLPSVPNLPHSPSPSPHTGHSWHCLPHKMLLSVNF